LLILLRPLPAYAGLLFVQPWRQTRLASRTTNDTFLAYGTPKIKSNVPPSAPPHAPSNSERIESSRRNKPRASVVDYGGGDAAFPSARENTSAATMKPARPNQKLCVSVPLWFKCVFLSIPRSRPLTGSLLRRRARFLSQRGPARPP